MMRQLIALVLACYSLSVMAQDGLLWGAGNWGEAAWGVGATPTPVPVMPIEGLAALITIIALLPVWTKVTTMLSRRR
jgi:hypothetical protein